MAKMSGATPSSAVRNAGLRTRELLLPFDLKFWLYASSASPFGKKDDPRLLELKRLKPYYRGTRLLTAFAILLILLSLVLPFTVAFVGMNGFILLLAAYIILFIAVSIIGIFFESAMDAILAIQYEEKISLGEAVKVFTRSLKTNRGYVVRYMVIKLAVDMFLMALVSAFFLPALLGAIAMLQTLIRAVIAGETQIGGLMTPWLIGITALLLAAIFLTGLCSVPISAFYGYYTEDAIKAMRQPEEKHGGK